MEVRVGHCFICGGDGGWDYETKFGPRWQQCENCKGTGETEIEVEPIEMEDLDEQR